MGKFKVKDNDPGTSRRTTQTSAEPSLPDRVLSTSTGLSQTSFSAPDPKETVLPSRYTLEVLTLSGSTLKY